MVRKVHSREELEALSQSELDKLLRDTEDELDESKGMEVAQEKEHKKELEELNATTQEAAAALEGKAAGEKQAYQDAKANFSGEADAVATMEEELRSERTPIMDLTFEMNNVKEEIGAKLMALSSCECKDAALLARKALLLKKAGQPSEPAQSAQQPAPVEEHFMPDVEDLAKAAAAKIIQGVQDAAMEAAADATQPVRAKAGLLSVAARGPERVKKVETAMEIEKLESEIVTVIRDTQDDQKAYDAGVAQLEKAQENREMNATQVNTEQEKAQELLDGRAEQQFIASVTLERMIADKKEQHASAEQNLADAKSELEALSKELADCGC